MFSAQSTFRHLFPLWTLLRAVTLRGLILATIALVPRLALAVPEARILRVDPRVSTTQGDPVLTTVLEVVEHKPLAALIGGCAALRGDAQLDCVSQTLDTKPLYTAFPFPDKNAIFTVSVDNSDLPAKYKQHFRWGDSQERPGVGTAWLILVDADKRIEKGFEDAKQVAQTFISSMGPNDIVNIMFFSDRLVVAALDWTPSAQRARAAQFVSSVAATYPSQSRNRNLLTIIKDNATAGFRSLGNVGQAGVAVPLHQALVVISTGYGGADALTTGAGALQLRQYITGGRFPEDNTALPKLPTPLISIYVPTPTWDEFKQNSTDFMQNLANPEVGGYYTVLRPGQGGRSRDIVRAVRTRFANMHIVEWRVSCLAPSVEQTFKLAFSNVTPPIAGDSTFKNVPIGLDPTTWPLDVNLDYSQKMAERDEGVYPGGNFRVFGNFCWGGNKERAEVYFLPAGQPLPTAMSGADPDKAKRTQQQLIAMGMKGETIEANDGYVEFKAPSKDKILHGSGKKAVVRLVVYDNKAYRVSGITANRIIELKGTTQPFYALTLSLLSPAVLIAVGVIVFLLFLLILVLLLRGGSRRRGSPPPAPVAANPGYAPGNYGGPGMGGYGNPPPGAGYGAAPNAPSPGYGAAPNAPSPGYGAAPNAPSPGYGAAPAPGYGAAPVAPAPGYGSAPVAAAPGYGAAPAAAPPQPAYGAAPAANHEFMYGQGQQAPRYGLTNEIPIAGAPPPDPYAPAGAAIGRAVLQGSAGVFTVNPGVDMRVGRDGSQCGILLSEPRVSGVHATLKLEGQSLLVRDENSNNGTIVNGNRLPPSTWAPVPNGSLLRFGPVEFSVHLE